jgi:Beta-propeller repeat
MSNQRRGKSLGDRYRARRGILLAAAACLIFQRVAPGAPLLFASNLGGSQWDAVRAIATDSSQNIYVVGETYSQDFPGAAASSSRQTGDAFIVKLNPTGTTILFSLVLGGSGYDSARGVAVDSSGNVYVTGMTSSPNFPVTTGALQPNLASPGQYDAFVVKVNSAGSVVYSTYLGGASSDAGYGIAVDSSGAAYVAGSTASVNFPVTSGAPQAQLGGSTNCFVAKLAPTGASLVYATYLGGTNIDTCAGVAVDSTGAAFVTGTTSSANFPVVAALDGALAGPSDAFLTKLSPAGNSFVFSTYLGGESVDIGNAVSLDSSGNAYVGGTTMSTEFPVTSGVVQPQLNGNYDGFLCSIANDGSAILFATYLGGSASDSINDLFVAPSGQIVVAGYTASSNFPTMNPIQSAFGGDFDSFAAVLAPGATSLVFSTYLGGGGDDQAFGVAPLGAGQLVFAGQVLSGTVSYMQQLYYSTPAGQYDGFVAAIAYAPLRFVPITPCRVVDTRNAAGPYGGPALAAGTSRSFVIANTCGVPSTAEAYSLNVAVVPLGPLGYLTVWPSGQPQPSVATLNSFDGRVKSNAAIIPAGAGGALSVYATNATQVILDINGYFVPASDTSALSFYPMTPCRIADTRNAPGPFGGPSLSAGQSRTFPVQESACNVPSGAQAYALNLTAVPSIPVGYLTAWPAGEAQPLEASLNVPDPTPTANAAIVGAGTGGSIEVFAEGTTDLVIDIDGYFAAPGVGGLSLYSVTPCRVLDTRQLPGAAPISSTFNVNVLAGPCPTPNTAQAYVFNVTVIPSGGLGYLTLWAEGQPQPVTATLNAWDGAVTNNMAIVATTNGMISAYPSDPTQLIFDLFGYFAP